MSEGNGAAPEPRSYHGQPVLKEPVWTWEIPCYFFTGGMAGASCGLAYLCELRGNDVLARRAWGAALLAGTVSPMLLTSDLGKPVRFFNMLRMFKITSPMSVGSWIVSGVGTASGVAAANAWTGAFERSGKLARPAAAILGLPMSTYTAALIANTAVPVWHEARRLLPFVFGSGAALSAAAACVAVTPPRHAKPARRLALASAVLEVGLNDLMHKQLGEHGEPYRQGAPAYLSHAARGLIAAGTILLARRGGSSRRAAVVAGSLLCAGALSARWSVFRAGFRSASDPRYVVGPQRRRIERGERQGAARRKPRSGEVDQAVGSPK